VEGASSEAVLEAIKSHLELADRCRLRAQLAN
jgi:hypothetical protein